MYRYFREKAEKNIFRHLSREPLLESPHPLELGWGAPETTPPPLERFSGLPTPQGAVEGGGVGGRSILFSEFSVRLVCK